MAGGSAVVKMNPEGEGAYEVAQRGGGGDVAADHAEALCQRALDDVETVRHAVARGDAGAGGAIEADGMDLVEVGQRVVALGGVADGGDGRDVTVHGVDGLEGDDLRHVGRQGGQAGLQVGDVVVGEHLAAGAAVADALDHGGVVLGVGQHDATGQAPGERAERGPVGHVAGVEQQGGLLAMQRGQRTLQVDVAALGAGDVARAAGAGAVVVERLVHGGEHGGVLAHAEVVVGAPHRDLAGGLAPVLRGVLVQRGARQSTCAAFQPRETAVVALSLEAVDAGLEELLVVHRVSGPCREVSRRRWRQGEVSRRRGHARRVWRRGRQSQALVGPNDTGLIAMRVKVSLGVSLPSDSAVNR